MTVRERIPEVYCFFELCNRLRRAPSLEVFERRIDEEFRDMV